MKSILDRGSVGGIYTLGVAVHPWGHQRKAGVRMSLFLIFWRFTWDVEWNRGN